MRNTSIEVNGLHTSYDGQPVLVGVPFAVGGNGIFGIAGRDSAGRATAVAILQGLRSREGSHVAVLGVHPARERERRRPHLGTRPQTAVLVDRLRVGEPLRLADRPCSMFPRAAALYGIRNARATLGWAADIRLILRGPGVSLVSVPQCRAAGGW
jgi:ABC-type multidrug transport system ATPase subunit